MITPPLPPFTHRTVFIPRTDRQGEGDHAVMHVAGEIDMYTGEWLKAALTLCIACRPATIHLDITDVTLLDSGGLDSLTSAQQDAAATGVTLLLTGQPAPIVERLLRLKGAPPLPGYTEPGTRVHPQPRWARWDRIPRPPQPKPGPAPHSPAGRNHRRHLGAPETACWVKEHGPFGSRRPGRSTAAAALVLALAAVTGLALALFAAHRR
ncbi:STAS domain-containing protein [Streptomyces sp. NPDC005953]|uniref:STAS domain-containing protein n=1 Tax=Streptomyces sp. NPDC005953 TaxID=3156719 RepID=UPI0033D30F6C